MAIDPTQLGFDQLLAQIEKLSPEVQQQLHQALTTKLSNGAAPASDSAGLKAGWGKDLVLSIADDFDEPLEEFKEYVE